jgi:hypothetical protein
VPTLFVGLHAALVSVIALFGLSFLADPCGGGDLCLGGILGLVTLGVAAFGAVGIVIWRAGHRASPLLVLDCALVALAGYTLFQISPYGPALVMLGALLTAALGLPGAVLAGRAVMTHRIERLLAVAALAGVAVFGGGGGVAVLGLGLLALGAGWLLARPQPHV